MARIFRRGLRCRIGSPEMLRSIGAPGTPGLGAAVQLGRTRTCAVLPRGAAQEADVARREGIGLAHCAQRDVLRRPFADAADGAQPRHRLLDRAQRLEQKRIGQRRLAGQLVRLCGTAVPPEQRSHAALMFAFPTAAQVAAADLAALGMPNARKAALVALAEAALADSVLFQPLGTVEDTVARLRAIRGVGEWTAQYIALRAVREPDAFPASDIGLLRGAAGHSGARPSPAELHGRAEPWRPWRAYAAQHLWAADAASQSTREEARHG